ncbi:hypothetical protein K6V98_07155 [Collinsella sp. AGMB00827]|uniref:Uncharacterized protein n=1 Tax=Collinsella ureilytica TaxID=2869515 RepID=A0ABS7ML84_9ACTN|nr:hypothetical protein [Collinsella urealyticum]MBY4798120.1 hypothetical protein [Collinsella urealyticum]
MEERLSYFINKRGRVADPAKRDQIDWEVTINKRNDKNKGVALAKETFKDDLSNVGAFIPESFKLNDQALTDDEVVDPATQGLRYAFPKDFGKTQAKISFSTRVAEPDVTQKVSNTARLEVENQDAQEAKATVQVNRPLSISKSLTAARVDAGSGEQSLMWTIAAGAPYQSFGPTWIGDILSAERVGQTAPKRIELVAEQSISGEKDSWQVVAVETLDPAAARSFPSFPADKTVPVPIFLPIPSPCMTSAMRGMMARLPPSLAIPIRL